MKTLSRIINNHWTAFVLCLVVGLTLYAPIELTRMIVDACANHAPPTMQPQLITEVAVIWGFYSAAIFILREEL